MREFKIGEEIRIRCVENAFGVNDCRDCFFRICDDACLCAECSAIDRTDGKNVHFELVED